jgi:tetratricopeptide (TPR) repeat protein
MLAACGDAEPASRTVFGGGASGAADPLPPEIQLQLDSGNIAYRERDYPEALRHFNAVVLLDPNLAAGWYGVGMTEAALGDGAAAESAMAQVHRLAPDLPLQHPSNAAPPNPHGQAAPR